MLKSLKMIALSAAILAGGLNANARMTDDQVVQYVKTASAQGKSKQQIGQELLAKGVTSEQVERLKARYENQTGSEVDVANQTVGQASAERRYDASNEVTPGALDDVQREVDGGANGRVAARRIYGHSVFNNRALTFEPNENIATPQNYRLGPGDEVVIDIWGANEDQIRQVISPEGAIMVTQIGPIYLNGLTIADANALVKKKFAAKYAGVAGNEPVSDINLTLGHVRTIQVDIMGEVSVPGTYRLSPFSTVFHALYKAGGINDIGTMRNIEVLRNGKRIVGVDVYEYLFDGKQTGNVRLQEGDVIIVPPFTKLVNIDGNVKRPMYYEMKDKETLADLINYAGGFSGDAYTEQVRLARQTGRENELFNIVSGDFKSYKLNDGDLVTVGTILDRYANRVELKGSVYRPGMYALASDLRTVRDLIKKADGLTEDAYLSRVILYRESPDLSLELIPIDLDGLMKGRVADITLKRNDVLVIPSVHEMEDRGSITIEGLVARPGQYPFADNTTIEDLVVQAGGLLNGASTARVEVARRIVDPTSLQPTEEIAQVFTFGLKDGLVIDGTPGFQLQPYDIVDIRRSPGYQVQRRVAVTGEVAFEGPYTLQKRTERVSDLVKRAGGITGDAYLRGARLTRRMTDDEVAARNQVLRMAGLMQDGESGDSISASKLRLDNNYVVAIDLEKAITYPGSDYDLVLQEGDNLFIPEMVNTVKIQGDVMFPNTVSYVNGKKLKYYIEQSGGYGERANKKKAFIVYMNGTVARAKGNVAIEPGCQIIIPSKSKGQPFDWAKLLTISTSFASLGTMAAAIATIAK